MPSSPLTWEEVVRRLQTDPAQERLVRDNYFDISLTVAADRFAQSREWAGVRALLGSRLGGHAVELGAGRGIASCAFARAGCRVTAIEPDPSRIVGAGAIRSLARENGLSIRVLQARGEVLPLPDAVADLAFGRAVLHHAADLNRFCAEAARILRPRGLFLCAREHVITDESERRAFLKIHPLHHCYGGEDARRLEEYLSAIQGAGLRIRRVLVPFEGAINEAPLSAEEAVRCAAAWIQPWCGWRAGLALARVAPIRRFLARWRAQSDRTPGRIYTFLAEKV